ncbi:hypothetical protein ES708_23496 [subsurface metagenome]
MTAHRGRRSIKGQQKRDVKRFVHLLNFHDRLLCETVFTAKAEQLFNLLKEQYGYVEPAAAQLFYALTHPYTSGDVLADSRGRGLDQENPPPNINYYTFKW